MSFSDSTLTFSNLPSSPFFLRMVNFVPGFIVYSSSIFFFASFTSALFFLASSSTALRRASFCASAATAAAVISWAFCTVMGVSCLSSFTSVM